MADEDEPNRRELLANIRKLTSIVLEKLEEGSKEKTLDQGQTRLLASIALRALRLWQEALTEQGAVPAENVKALRAAEHELGGILDNQDNVER